MIVSASYRTDIPAFWSGWFRSRLAAGFCDVASPRGGRPYRVGLGPGAADGFVFWTRNAAPFGDALADVAARGLPFVVQFTVTGYPRVLDPHVPRADDAAAQVAALARAWGRRAVVWRYDPVAITTATPPEWHYRNFAALAARLEGAVDECVVSFLHAYRKTRRRLDAASRRAGLAWRDPEAAERREICARLAALAAGRGMRLAVCSQPVAVGPGAAPARCVDAGRLSEVAGREIRARAKGNRPGCLCSESRDVGAYDSCVHGCVYCYAVSSHAAAAARVRRGAAGGQGPGPLPPSSSGASSSGAAGALATATLAGRSRRSCMT